MWRIAMGTRQSEQASMWVATAELPKSPGHPFYTRLNALLDADDFGRFVEGQCAKFYAPVMGRPSRSARLQWGRAHLSAEIVEVAI
jgi:transposase